MIVKNRKEKKIYLLKLKNEINEFTLNYKKRAQRFPWAEVNKIGRLTKFKQTTITVNGKKFTVKELLRELNKTKNKISLNQKPSTFNVVLRAYTKDAAPVESSQIKKVYNTYHTELESQFKTARLDLAFCLSSLIELNKSLKNFKEKSVNESYEDIITERTHKTGFFHKLYHVSENNLDGKVLHPRIPENRLTKAGLEEALTPRVCFTPSIDNALMALSQNLSGKEFYVHVPVDKTKYDDVSKHQVADAKVTKEKWVTCDVELKCIGKIKVENARDKKYSFDFRDVNKEAVKKSEMNPIDHTYKWNWKWMEKYKTESEDTNMFDAEKELAIMESELFDNVDEDINDIDDEFTESESEAIEAVLDYGLVTEGVFATNASAAAAIAKYKSLEDSWLTGIVRTQALDNAYFAAAKEIAKLSLQYFAGAVVVGAVLDKVTRKFLRSRLNNYTKIHKDCIPFREFKKVKYTLNEFNKKFGKKFDIEDEYEAATNCYVYYHKNKPAFAIAIGQLSLTALTGSKDITTTSFSGQKKVDMVIMDNQFKKYEDFYFANMATVHSIFHPCLRRFIKLAHSEWVEFKKSLEKIKSKIEKNEKVAKESLEDTFDDVIISESGDVLSIQDVLLEAYTLCNDIDDDIVTECEEDIITEGANIEYTKELKKIFKEYCDTLKSTKKAIKDNRFNDARKYIKQMKSSSDKAKKAISNIDGNVFSAIIGFIIGNLIMMGKLTIPLLITASGANISLKGMFGGNTKSMVKGTALSGVGGLFTQIFALVDVVKELISIINHIKNKKGDIIANDILNRYRSQIDILLSDINKSLTALEKFIDKKEEKYKERQKAEKVVKESAEMKAERLAIYEACSNGEITIEEREAKLAELRNDKIMEKATEVVESVTSKNEKFKKVKLALYEKCNQGYINVTEREEMINRAYNMIFETEETPAQPTEKPQDDKNVSKEADKAQNDLTKEVKAQMDKKIQ